MFFADQPQLSAMIEGRMCTSHPNVNTATITQSPADFQPFPASCGNPVRALTFLS
ncbi:MAG: hypothetical protein NTV14_01755 [Coprothermobacterota bacterium]|nr:hypothetical protein [Coprothermobacterota bacterium]